MLGDCYTCAIVEHLSKQELMGNSNQHYDETNIHESGGNNLVPELIVVNVEMEKNNKNNK